MHHISRLCSRRDLAVGLLASLLTGIVLVPLGWATIHEQRGRAEAAHNLALEAARLAQQDAAQARDEAQRALVDQATDVLANMGGPKKAEAEAMRVTTGAVAPEVPEGAYLLIDKKASAYAAGDIVVFRVGANILLGRVLAVQKEAGRLTIGRNNETDRQVSLSEVVGRGALNTR